MSDEGFLDNSPELRLTLLKQKLRVLANTILDVRLQTHGHDRRAGAGPDDQRHVPGARGGDRKLQRAKLSSTQLPTYYAGSGWLEVREKYKQAKGSAFTLRDFHDRALRESAVPLPELQKLLLPETE